MVRNKLAEICEKYLSKGDKVYCEGRLKTRQWEQDGQKRYTTEIHVVDMTFLTTKSNPEGAATSQTPSPQSSPAMPKDDDNDDLPF